MTSLSKVLKAQTVKLDKDNRINIDVGFIVPQPMPDSTFDKAEEETPEEIARNIINKANRDAEKIVNQAKREASNLLDEAKAQAEEESRVMCEQAHEEGYREGYRKAELESKHILEQANQVLADAKRERAASETSLEPDMVDLIIKIVQKLLNDTVRLNPDAVVNLIRQGFAGATITGDVFIHVSQHDFEQVVQSKEALMSLTDGSVNLEIIRDLSLDMSDCVIETTYGNIDCSLNQQFDALRNQLVYILKNK